MKAFRFFTIAAFALCVSAPSIAADVDYSKIINLAGKQRMLTQKISKEVLLVSLDVDWMQNIEHLKKTRGLFDKTLKGLRNGDDELGLPPTKKPRIVSGLDDVDGLWAEFNGVLTNVIQNEDVDDEQLSAIASQNVPLLKAMNKVVKLYEAASSSGDLNPALAKAINLAGRQRMLTQKMSKEFFLVAKGHNVDSSKADLAKTIALFDTTLTGLIDGDDAQGLSPAPTDEILAQLNKVKSMWSSFKSHIEGEPKPASIQAVANENLPLLKEMNKAVGMFEALAG